MKYLTVSRYCDCHIETCCCDSWAVVDVDINEEVATFYLKGDAEKLQKVLNITEK